MKSSDFRKQLNELPELAHWIGDYGAAGAQQIANRFFGKGGTGSLSVTDRMAKNKFIRDFVGKATHSLDSSIKSGLVDPKARGLTANPPPTQPQDKEQTVKPNVDPVTTGPDIGVVGAGGAGPGAPSPGTADASGGGATSTTEPKPGSPEYFAAKRAAAAKAAQDSMTPVPAKTGTTEPQPGSPEYFAAKRAAAAKAAQDNMTPAPPKPGQQAFDQMASDLTKTPSPGEQAFGQMAGALTKQPKIDPKAAAALKGRLKAGQGLAGQTGSGFSNYVKGSGERFYGADDQGAPVFRKLQRENHFNKLNAIFESIIGLPEQTTPVAQVPQKRSIAQHLKNWWMAYTQLKRLPPDAETQVNNLVTAVQNTWGKDKGYQALLQLANLGYTLLQSDEGAKAKDDEKTSEKPIDSQTAYKELSTMLATMPVNVQKQLFKYITTFAYVYTPPKSKKEKTDATPDATTQVATPKTEPEVKDPVTVAKEKEPTMPAAYQTGEKKKRTGGRKKGELSTNPRAVRRRMKNAAKRAGTVIGNQPNVIAQAKKKDLKGEPGAGIKAAAEKQPLYIGKGKNRQKISPDDPLYDRIKDQLAREK